MYNRESKIMRKLLGKAAPDATTGDLSIANTPASISSSYRPLKSQNAVYPLSTPISCFDVTTDRRAVVLGGPHILKTVVLDGAESPAFNVSDGIDARTAITSQKTSGTRASVVSDQLNIRDVKWHGNSTIFTACATGRIFAYDLTRLGAGATDTFEYVQTQEDSRQVNTLDVNPHLKSWLLSGSQDGMARIFDVSQALPTRSGVLTFRQRFLPLKSNDPIRQVKWSPKVGHEMACCTEAGVILKWDVRQSSRPLLRINAHEKACTSIEWHPDGTHLLSAGWDTKLHVWDLGNSADKRQKAKYSVTIPAPVGAVAWRPSLWSASAQTRRAAQIAVSYDDSSSRRYGSSVVHIWDLARPTMPYKEIERFDTSPSALIWRDQDMLWTVGQDGVFNQCDVAFAPKVIERYTTSAVAFSPRGEAIMFLDERTQPSSSKSRMMLHAGEIDASPSYSTSPRTPILSGSKSDSEEDVMTSFLGPSKRSIHKRRLSNRSSQLLSTTPPSASTIIDDQTKTLSLEQSINVTGTFKSQQSMAWGQIPAVQPASVYQFMSSHYLDILSRDLPHVENGKTMVQRITSILEQFAGIAELANLFRLSQTWRILAFGVGILLNKRAEYHLDSRLSRFQKMDVDGTRGGSNRLLRVGGNVHHEDDHPTNGGEETPRHPSGHGGGGSGGGGGGGSIDGRFQSLRSLLSEEIESTSNVPTPIARPVDFGGDGGTGFDTRHYQHGKRLTPILEPESLKLGPALHHSFTDSSHGSTALSGASLESDESKASITEGYDFYDTEALSAAIDMPPARATKEVATTWANRRPDAVRQDSNDSFNRVFSISNGTKDASELLPSSSSDLDKMKKQKQRHDIDADSDKTTISGRSEYHSRIRGEDIEVPAAEEEEEEGTVRRNNPRRSSPSQAESPEGVFMISQTTASGDGTYPSQTSFVSQSDSDNQPSSFHTSTMAQETRSNRADSLVKSIPAFQNDARPHIVETDYLPWENDPDYTEMKGEGTVPPTALNPYALIVRALSFETRTSALHASAMVLLLKPLVPDSIIDTHQARGILRQHHSRLMGMSLFVEAALLRKLCLQGWPEGLPEWGESYPAIFSQAQQHVKVGLFCSSCQKPREIEPGTDRSAIWTCERCQSVMAPCSICQHRELELPSYYLPHMERRRNNNSNNNNSTVDSLDLLSGWWYCPGCGHGGHASCLQVWHGVTSSTDSDYYPTADKYSEGCCPLDGCGHACLPGKYRGETTTARSGEVGRAAAENYRLRDEQSRAGSSKRHSSPNGWSNMTDRSVRSDSNDVPQSKAVGIVRDTLNKGGSSSGGSAVSGGILSSSPGRIPGTGERERRKSVKFAKPG